MDLHHFCLHFVDQRKSNRVMNYSLFTPDNEAMNYALLTERPHKSQGKEKDAYFSYKEGDIKFSGQKCTLLLEHSVGRGLRT